MRRMLEASEIEKIRKVEQERIRKNFASDLHDELGQNLTNISLYSTLIKRELTGDSGKVGEYLNKVISASTNLSIGIRELIWALDPDQNTIKGLQIRLQNFGDDLFQGTNIRFRANKDIEDFEFLLSMDWMRHIALIFKEAMRNSLIHSACSNAILEFYFKSQILEVFFFDDGRGFDPSQKTGSGGQGLRTMKSRAEKVHGFLNITATRGEGTRIHFKGDLNNAVS